MANRSLDEFYRNLFAPQTALSARYPSGVPLSELLAPTPTANTLWSLGLLKNWPEPVTVLSDLALNPDSRPKAGSVSGLSLLAPAANTLATLAFPQRSQYHQWIAVRPRFTQFHRNLELTPLQIADGVRKRAGVVSCLNRAYYGISSETEHSFLVGSWGKNTAIRPPRDVDVYFLLPGPVYGRFQARFGNRQSALLQEVKELLAVTYPDTDMSGDGQVVVVRFDGYSVEVVPAFTANGRYWICNTHDGGSYKETAPWAEVQQLDAGDSANARNLRPLVRMMKAWQSWCAVPIKSFHLELLATQFIWQSRWRFMDYFYFDWITRDFFEFLCRRADGCLVVPGTNEVAALGNAWLSRAVFAHRCAVNPSSRIRGVARE